MSFKKDRYLIIKKTVSDKLIKFIYDYFLIKRKAIEYMYKNNVIQENILFGTWKDEQVPNVYSVYSGCELEHWREEFKGDICAQVFLHYNHINGQFKNTNLYDNRPLLGLPHFIKKK